MVIKKLDEKAGKETKYVAPIFKAKNRTPYEIRVDMLRQLEGIGQVTAEKIWEYCKTWENLIECIIEEDGQLMEIVGAKRFNHLREIFVS
jgi:ERCC4-type nuclease